MITLKRTLNLGTLSAILLAAVSTHADQVILDDLIVDGSICVGQDCVNGESFGFDTLRLKENNLRIKAVDTSTTSSFPSRDWQITFNDSANGGANKFSIDDIDGGRTPFTLEAGAPSHSLYVDDGGRLGLGTSTPVVDVHVKSGNTPTLRLEQDGTSGFTPQTWDVAGNEANFFVRDATNGSTLPFRIEPGVPSDAIYVEDTGHIGLGHTAPDMNLHIKDSTGGIAGLLHLENDGGSYMELLKTGGNAWVMAYENNVADRFLINYRLAAGGSTSVAEFTTAGDFNVTGDITGAQLISTGGGVCTATPCDGVFRPDEFTVASIEDHASFMWSNEHLKAVGPTSKDEPFNVTHKTAGILHELETAHIYIEQLNDQIKVMQQQVDKLAENSRI